MTTRVYNNTVVVGNTIGVHPLSIHALFGAKPRDGLLRLVLHHEGRRPPTTI